MAFTQLWSANTTILSPLYRDQGRKAFRSPVHYLRQLLKNQWVTEPPHLEPVLHNKRGRGSERPTHCDEEWPPLATTRESPRTETKTQHSHKLKKTKTKNQKNQWVFSPPRTISNCRKNQPESLVSAANIAPYFFASSSCNAFFKHDIPIKSELPPLYKWVIWEPEW